MKKKGQKINQSNSFVCSNIKNSMIRYKRNNELKFTIFVTNLIANESLKA